MITGPQAAILTDEQFGRAWAKQEGKRPFKRRGYGFSWYTCTDRHEDPKSQVPPELNSGIDDSPYFGFKDFDTESDAYAALGRAVRAVHAAVPMLKDSD